MRNSKLSTTKHIRERGIYRERQTDRKIDRNGDRDNIKRAAIEMQEKKNEKGLDYLSIPIKPIKPLWLIKAALVMTCCQRYNIVVSASGSRI